MVCIPDRDVVGLVLPENTPLRIKRSRLPMRVAAPFYPGMARETQVIFMVAGHEVPRHQVIAHVGQL